MPWKSDAQLIVSTKSLRAIIASSMRSVFNFCSVAFNTEIEFYRPFSFRKFVREFWVKWFKFSVKIRMFRGSHQNKIFFTIIKSIVIFMMNNLVIIKRMTQFFLHDISVFIFPSSTIRYFYLPIRKFSISPMFSSRTNRFRNQSCFSIVFYHLFNFFRSPIWFWKFSQSKPILLNHCLSSLLVYFRTELMTCFERCSSRNWIRHTSFYAF